MRSVTVRGMFLCLLAAAALAAGQEPGEQIFRNTCAACHGPDGRGASRNTVGFDNPLPDFSDCRFAVREADADWSAIIHNGGPARGFSEIMPSFREALKKEEIDQVLSYLRGFCQERAWPRGELNLPRALITEKAFPEDELLLTTSVNLRSGGAASHNILYEKRFGPRNQLEIMVPFRFRERTGGDWSGGVGDIALGWKRVLFHSLRSGSIFSGTVETVLPTGDKARGLGKGVAVVESFAAFGQLLPRDSFLQFQGGFEGSTRPERLAHAAFGRAVAGKTFAQGEGFGRAWSPMVEFLADRDIESGARTNWDILPQFQVTLSARQHLRANFGVRIPANNTAGRPVQLVFYLLWDWFDGGLRDGW